MIIQSVPYPAAGGGGSVPSAALVYETISDGAAWRTFDAEAYDNGEWWNPAVPANLTVPAGVSLARVVGQTTTSGESSPSCTHQKNGAGALGCGRNNQQENWIGAISAPIAVSPADYFTQGWGTGSPDTTGGMWCGAEALDPATKYALVSKTATQALSAGVSTAVSWNNEVIDTSGWHDNATNNSRLTVPAGVSRVRVTFSVQSTAFVNTPYFAYIAKNGAAVPGGAALGQFFGGRINAGSAILEVSPGDYFEVIALSNAAQTIANNTEVWFAIEEVPDYSRVLVAKANTQAVSSGVTTAIQFGTGSTVYDADSLHSEATNNSRLTIPAGVSRARLCFGMVGADAGGVQKVWVRKNGAGTVPLIGLPGMDLKVSGVDYLNGVGAWVDVTAGDYFELMLTPGENMTLPAEVRTYFGMELA